MCFGNPEVALAFQNWFAALISQDQVFKTAGGLVRKMGL